MEQSQKALARALERVGGKWSLLILDGVLEGRHTFRDLQQFLPGIPSNLLSARLKALERDGLIVSALYSDHPPRYRYLPSDSTKELRPVFEALSRWGERHCPAAQEDERRALTCAR